MKKVIYCSIGLLFFIQNTLPAQTSVAEITQQITEGKTTDSTRVEAIYDWLIQNISYDHAHKRQREGDTVLRQEPYNVIVFKKAVCMGFAKTFREMCHLSGIEAHLVEGNVKNTTGIIQREGHAWNAVKLNNLWYLVDATWDSGLPISEKKYFLKDPSVFVENHLPRDPIWQLLTAPISIDCFRNASKCGEMSPTLSAFNFSDSIRLMLRLDSTQQLYNQAVRILNYNPEDLIALHDLGDYYTQKARLIYSEYKQIRKDVADKKRLPNRKSDVLKLLDTTTNYIKSALYNYQELAKLKPRNALTDIDMNLESIQETLVNLANEKVFISKYFKE